MPEFVVFLGDPVQALADWGWVVAGDACAAEVIGGQVDGSGDGFHGQIAQGIAFELSGHLPLDFVGKHTVLQELRGVQFVDGGHVNTVKAWRDDRGASDSHVDFLHAS